MKLAGGKEFEIATRMNAVWDSIFKVEYDEALRLGFLERDAITLNVIGMPNFAAPHIWLIQPDSSAGEFIKLGEDEDEQSLLYNKIDGQVWCLLHDGRKNYVSPGILEFIECLLALAELIDRAIETVGPDVFSEGPFPKGLISTFSKRVDELLGANAVRESFWATEINRMSALASNDGVGPQ